MSNCFKLSMLFTSFFPLWLSIIFLDILSIVQNKTFILTEIIQISVIGLGLLLSIFYLFFAFRMVKQDSSNEYQVQSVQHEKSLASEFLLSYILPLFAFDFTQWIGTVQFLIYFLVLSFLCIRNNQVYTNIIFEVMGYRFYTCEVKDAIDDDLSDIEIILIAKHRPMIHHTINIVPLNKPFYLEK